MQRGRWFRSWGSGSRGETGLRHSCSFVRGRVLKIPLRVLALALFCAGVAALLALRGVAAQTPTDYDTDNDGLIEVDSLAKLNAIRWDLNGDGVVESADQTNYLAAYANAPVTAGCTYDHDGDSQTTEVACIGYELTANLNFDTNGNNELRPCGRHLLERR